MTKPSKQPIMNEPANSPKGLCDRVKKLRVLPQSEKVKEEIKGLMEEYKKRFLKHL